MDSTQSTMPQPLSHKGLREPHPTATKRLLRYTCSDRELLQGYSEPIGQKVSAQLDKPHQPVIL